jgi:hypothetical protein
MPFWTNVDERVAQFTSERLSNPRLAVWLLGEDDKKEAADVTLLSPNSKTVKEQSDASVHNWDVWVRTLMPAERATLALLLVDAEMWDQVVGESAARLVCASLVRVCGESPVEHLHLTGAQAPPGRSAICYRLCAPDITNKPCKPAAELVRLGGVFHLPPAQYMAMMPSIKQSNIVARCRTRISHDQVLASYLSNTGHPVHPMHPWFQLLAFYLAPLVAQPELRTNDDMHWFNWLTMAHAMLELVHELSQSPWHDAIVAFRLAWLISEELDAYDDMRKKHRLAQANSSSSSSSTTANLSRALRGNPRAPNGYETHAQMLARKQLQADMYGWKIEAH